MSEQQCNSHITSLNQLIEGLTKRFDKFEEKLDRYNGMREKVANLEKSQDGAKKWIGSLVIGLLLVVFEMLTRK